VPDIAVWGWLALACGIVVVLGLGGIRLAIRPGRDDAAGWPARGRPSDAAAAWHVVEEYVPAGGDQPGRWVETRRTRDRAEAEQEWFRLRREDPAQQDGVRIVTTTAAPAERRGPAPRPAARPQAAPRGTQPYDLVPRPTPSPEGLTSPGRTACSAS
jgi:hypothetical protein